MWKPANGFEYDKRFYWVLFEGWIAPVRCWPNAGKYEPIAKDLNQAFLGEPSLIWDELDDLNDSQFDLRFVLEEDNRWN